VAAVAARLIADSGLEAVTVRDVALAAGCSTAIVSHYFHNKRELLLFTYRYSIEAATTLSHESLGPGGDDLRAYVAALMPFDGVRRMNWKIWFAFWAKAAADEEFALIQRDCVRRTRGDIECILNVLQHEGRLLPGADGASEARRLLVIIMGLAVQVVFDPEDWTLERQLAFVDAELEAFLRPALSPGLGLASQDAE
jgi:AcrR family transcriptional regulator